MQLREGACKGRARWGSPGGLSRLSVLYAYEHPSLPDKVQKLNWVLLYHRHHYSRTKATTGKNNIKKEAEPFPLTNFSFKARG